MQPPPTPKPMHHRPSAPYHDKGGGPGCRPHGARPALPIPCSPGGCERIPCAAGSTARPLTLKTELFLSELKRDVSQQPAFLPGLNTSCRTRCPLLSPPGAGKGHGGSQHGWDPPLGTQQPRPGEQSSLRQPPVVPHPQGWWLPPLAPRFGVPGSAPQKVRGTPQLLLGGAFLGRLGLYQHGGAKEAGQGLAG